MASQADQLAVAVRSPIAAQEEEHDGGVELLGECPGVAALVEQCEIGNLHASASVGPGRER